MNPELTAETIEILKQLSLLPNKYAIHCFSRSLVDLTTNYSSLVTMPRIQASVASFLTEDPGDLNTLIYLPTINMTNGRWVG